jgi:hypothetical protein
MGNSYFSSVVINQFNVEDAPFNPAEADSILIIHPYAVLSDPSPLEFLEPYRSGLLQIT